MKKNIVLFLILIFFLITRLYNIAGDPPSVYWDEASIGYNAYSVSINGKDEWGKFLPLHFRAFGEFKLPVYIYSTVPFVNIFGLNEVSVRLPAVLFSLISVVLIYLIGKRIFDKKVGLLAVFFLTISPWFFILSRVGYEATAGLAFFCLGIYLFLIANNRSPFLFSCLFSFILSMYSYNSFRIVTPLTLIFLGVAFLSDKKIAYQKKVISISLAVFILILSFIPIFRLVTSQGGNLRFQAVSIFGSGDNQIETLVNFIKNYFSHFSIQFLFTKGDLNHRSQQPMFGQLYTLDLLMLAFSLFYFLKKFKKIYLLPLFIIFVSLIPASLTKEAPHALRSIAVVPFISLLFALGLNQILKKTNWQKIFVSFFITFYLLMFLQYFYSFIKYYPGKTSQDWQFAYKQVFKNYSDQFGNFDKVIISDKYAQPYIFALFYLNYNPGNFLKSVEYNSMDKWGFSTVKKFGKFEFSNDENMLIPEGKTLVFLTKNKFLVNNRYNIKLIGRINFLDNTNAFNIYEINN